MLQEALGLALGVAEVAWSGASLPFAILTFVNAPYKHGFPVERTPSRTPMVQTPSPLGSWLEVTITATIILVSTKEACLGYTDLL